MAKSKSKSRQRDASQSSLDSLLSIRLRPPPRLLPLPHAAPVAVAAIEDRRLFQPGRSTTPPRAVRRDASRVVASQTKALNSLRFADPSLVSLCAKRVVRREVLFALRKTKKGSGSRRRRNFWSRISCSAT